MSRQTFQLRFSTYALVLTLSCGFVAPNSEAGVLSFCGQILGRFVNTVDRVKVRLGICNTCRQANEYFFDFGPALLEDLQRLGPNDVVVEWGVGEGYFAKQVFLGHPYVETTHSVVHGYHAMGRDMIIPLSSSHFLPSPFVESIKSFAARPPEEKPLFIGVGQDKLTNLGTPRVQFLAGNADNAQDQMHQIISEKGQVSLFLDQYGVVSYTRDLSGHLQRSVDALKVGGSYYLHLSEKHLGIIENGLPISVSEFLETIPGLEVTRLEIPTLETQAANNPPKPVTLAGGLRIRKLQESVEIPKLIPGPGIPLPEGVSIKTFQRVKPTASPSRLGLQTSP